MSPVRLGEGAVSRVVQPGSRQAGGTSDNDTELFEILSCLRLTDYSADNVSKA